jgi:DNA-binding MarR family transcriptional regulator
VQDELSKRLASLDVTHAQAVALVRLWRADGGRLPQSELARSLALSRPSTALVLKALEQKGLIARNRDFHDGRRMVVELTAGGRALEPAVAKVVDEVEVELVAGLSGTEQDEADRLLRALMRSARTLRDA